MRIFQSILYYYELCSFLKYGEGLPRLVDGYVLQVRNVSGSGTFRFLIFAELRLPNRCAVRQNPGFNNKYSNSTFHILNFTIQPVPTFHVLLLLQVLLKYFYCYT